MDGEPRTKQEIKEEIHTLLGEIKTASALRSQEIAARIKELWRELRQEIIRRT